MALLQKKLIVLKQRGPTTGMTGRHSCHSNIRKGTIIKANDLLIAAHAKALDAILVSNNEKEFKRVVGLSIESWV